LVSTRSGDYPFKPRKNKRVFEDIASQIRGAIHSGFFKPGDKLPPERELSKQFNAGRMAVREALRALEESGLIQIKQGVDGGAFIRVVDFKVASRSIYNFLKLGEISLQELTEARIEIELMVLKYCINRISQEEINELDKIIVTAENIFKKGEAPTQGHINFHIFLAKASKNAFFEMVLTSIMNVVISFLNQLGGNRKFYSAHFGSHRMIFEAIKAGNLVLAQERLTKHIMEIQSRISDARLEGFV